MRNTGMISVRLLNMAVLKMLSLQEKMGDYVLFKNLDGKYLTLKDCIEENKKRDRRNLRLRQKKRKKMQQSLKTKTMRKRKNLRRQ